MTFLPPPMYIEYCTSLIFKTSSPEKLIDEFIDRIKEINIDQEVLWTFPR